MNQSALRMALDAGFEAGRIADVRVADVQDALDSSWVPGAFESWRQEHGDAAPAQRWLDLLGPLLPAYRREPHLAQPVEALEHLAAGGTQESFRGSFDLAAQPTNLS